MISRNAKRRLVMTRERERKTERETRFFFLTENFLRETNSWESERQARNCACIARKRAISKSGCIGKSRLRSFTSFEISRIGINERMFRSVSIHPKISIFTWFERARERERRLDVRWDDWTVFGPIANVAYVTYIKKSISTTIIDIIIIYIYILDKYSSQFIYNTLQL